MPQEQYFNSIPSSEDSEEIDRELGQDKNHSSEVEQNGNAFVVPNKIKLNDAERQKMIDQLAKNHKEVVYFLISKKVPMDLVEDMAQIAFMKAQKYLDTYDGTSALLTWQNTIAYNTYLSHIRPAKNNPYINTKLEHLEFDRAAQRDSVFSGKSLNPRDSAISKEEVLRIRKAIQNLPKKQRDVIELIMEELSREEISKILKIPPGTVRSRTATAKASIYSDLGIDIKRNKKRGK